MASARPPGARGAPPGAREERLAGDQWIRWRVVAGVRREGVFTGRALITDDAGRFRSLPMLDERRPQAPLSRLGMSRSDGIARKERVCRYLVPELISEDDVLTCLRSHTGDAAPSLVLGRAWAMDAARLRGLSERVRGVRSAWIELQLDVADLAPALVDLSVAQRIALTIDCDAERLDAISQAHERFAEHGISPDLAYLNARIALDDACVQAGPGRLMDACSANGVRFVELVLPPQNPASTAFYAGFVERALQSPEPIFERWFSLGLEAMAAASRGQLLGPSVGTSQRLAPGESRVETRAADGCGRCVYEPYCSSDLLGSLVRDASVACREPNTDWCQRALIALDLVFALSFSDPKSVRGFLDQLGETRDGVAARLSAAKTSV